MTAYGVNTIAAYVEAGALILLAPTIVAYLVVLAFLFYRLRHDHPQRYEELGAPSLFTNNSVSKGFTVVRYLLDEDYLGVPDIRVNQLGKRSRQLLLASALIFGVALVAFAMLWATF